MDGEKKQDFCFWIKTAGAARGCRLDQKKKRVNKRLLNAVFSCLVVLHVLIDGEHILGVDTAVVVDIFDSDGRGAVIVLHKLVDGEYILGIDTAVAIHIFGLEWEGTCDGDLVADA